MAKKKKKNKLNYDQVIALMSVYEAEFEHRDTVLYSRMFNLFHVSLIIMIFPFVAGKLPIFELNMSANIFVIFGMLCENVSFLISIIHADRLSKSSITYKKLIDNLPKKYRRRSTINRKNNKDKVPLQQKIADIRLVYIVPILLFLLIISIGIILLIFYNI